MVRGSASLMVKPYFWRCVAAAFAIPSLGWAQITPGTSSPGLVRPASLEVGLPLTAELTATAPRTPDGKPYNCYAIDTTAGGRWTVTLKSQAFDSGLSIARGALCSAASLQHQNDNAAPGDLDARVTFTAVGGRYLILARGMSTTAAGAYELTATPEAADLGYGGSTQLADNRTDARRALMEAQVGERRAQLAEEAARKQAAEQAATQARLNAEAAARRAERERKRARSEAFNSFLGAAVGAMGEVTNQMAAENSRIQAETSAMIARQAAQAEVQRAAQQRAQAQARAQAAEQAARQLAQNKALVAASRNGGGGGYGIGYSPQTRAAAAQQQNAAQVQSGTAASQVLAQQQAQQRQLAEQQRLAQQRAAEQQASQQRFAQQQAAQARAEADRQQRAQEAERRRMAQQQADADKARMIGQSPSGAFSTVGLRAINPSGSPGAGRLSRPVSNVGGCRATNISVSYKLDDLLGEATVNGEWSWQGDGACTPAASTKVWLRLQDGSAYGYVEISPSVPRAGGASMNTTGSPDWSQLVCGFDGGRASGCMDAASARKLWTNGRVAGFEVGW